MDFNEELGEVSVDAKAAARRRPRRFIFGRKRESRVITRSPNLNPRISGSAESAGHGCPKELPPLVLGVGDGRGFGGHVSPAKLALADELDRICGGFELRIHGVGGSSPE